jgi:hypothetical protein
MKAEVTAEAVKSAPPATIAGVGFILSLDLNHLVGIATLAYIGLQAGYLLWKWVREYRAARGK